MQLIRFILIGIACFGLSACETVFPQAAELEDVHRAYQLEFAQNVTGLTQSANRGYGFCSSASGSNGFPQTRERIDYFRTRYGSDSAQAAHLTVLEGMIYLQLNQFELARAYQSEVATAGTQLTSGNGNKTRDALFAESYASLVSGWEAVCLSNNNTCNTSVLTDASNTLKQSGDALEAVLAPYFDPEKMAPNEVDQGALYIAAALVQFRRSQKITLQEAYCGARPESFEQMSQQAQQGLNDALCLMGTFLTEQERTGQVTGTLSKDKLTGRLRFVQIYRDALSKQPGSLNCAKAV